MKEIETAGPGSHISKSAKSLVDSVKKDGDSFMNFNGILLAANQFSTVESICADYDRLCDVRQKEYAASPEGKAAKRKQEADRKRLQKDADRLMADLSHLDFNNVGNLLHWLCAMEDPRNRIGVNVDAGMIQRTFMKHGYEPNTCCGDEFDENDKETFARWLIGQAIADVYVPMVQRFTEQWRDRFGKR